MWRDKLCTALCVWLGAHPGDVFSAAGLHRGLGERSLERARQYLRWGSVPAVFAEQLAPDVVDSFFVYHGNSWHAIRWIRELSHHFAVLRGDDLAALASGARSLANDPSFLAAIYAEPYRNPGNMLATTCAAAIPSGPSRGWFVTMHNPSRRAVAGVLAVLPRMEMAVAKRCTQGEPHVHVAFVGGIIASEAAVRSVLPVAPGDGVMPIYTSYKRAREYILSQPMTDEAPLLDKQGGEWSQPYPPSRFDNSMRRSHEQPALFGGGYLSGGFMQTRVVRVDLPLATAYDTLREHIGAFCLPDVHPVQKGLLVTASLHFEESRTQPTPSLLYGRHSTGREDLRYGYFHVTRDFPGWERVAANEPVRVLFLVGPAGGDLGNTMQLLFLP